MIDPIYDCPVHGKFRHFGSIDQNVEPLRPGSLPLDVAQCPMIVRVSGMSHGGSGPDAGAWLPCGQGADSPLVSAEEEIR